MYLNKGDIPSDDVPSGQHRKEQRIALTECNEPGASSGCNLIAREARA